MSIAICMRNPDIWHMAAKNYGLKRQYTSIYVQCFLKHSILQTRLYVLQFNM